jgi:hypothetical protein
MNAHDNRSLPVRFATHLHCAPYSMSCDLAVVCCTVCCTRRANQYRLCSTQRALGGTPSSTQRVKHSVPADLNLLQLCALTGTVYVYVHYTYTVPVGTWSSVYLQLLGRRACPQRKGRAARAAAQRRRPPYVGSQTDPPCKLTFLSYKLTFLS